LRALKKGRLRKKNGQVILPIKYNPKKENL
jgi:hypothetical protein